MATTRTPEQEAARQKLLATGKYELYTKANGQTDIRLKKEYQKTTTPTTAGNVTVTPAPKVITGPSVTTGAGTAAGTIPTVAPTGGTAAGTGTTTTPTATSATPTTAAAKDPNTYVDATIQKYKDQFAAAEAKNDIQGMISAAKAADDYRASIGMARINDAYIKTLEAKLTTKGGTSGGGIVTFYDENGNPQQVSSEYLDQVPSTWTKTPPGSTGGTLGEVKAEDATGTTQQLADMISRLNDTIQNFNANYKPSEELNEYAERIRAEIDRLLQEREAEGTAAITKARGDITTEGAIQSRGLEEAYQKQLDELAGQADEIRNAYTAGKRGIETEKAETMPEYQAQRSQADVQAQQAAKNVIDYFKKQGLGAGGQAGAAVAETAQAGLGAQAGINVEESKYLRDVSDRLAGLEEQQAAGLSDIERMKGQAGSEMAGGKRNIIERVQNSLSGLSIDEKNLLDELSRTREQMESEIETQYKDMTREEKNDAFNQLIAQAGFGIQAADSVRQLVDDIVKIRADEAEAKQKEEANKLALRAQELQNQLSEIEVKYADEKTKLEIKQLEKTIEQIGKTEALSDAEKQIQDLEIQRITAEIARIQAETSATKNNASLEEIIQIIKDDLATMTADEAYDELRGSNKEMYIQDMGVDEYNKLLTAYQKAAGY